MADASVRVCHGRPLADVEASLEAVGESGKPIAACWEDENVVESEEQFKQLLRVQMRFPFHREPPPE